MRLFLHPSWEAQELKIQLYLDSLVDSGDLMKDADKYVVTGAAIRTFQRYEEEERRHTEAVKLQRFILGSEFIPVTAEEPSHLAFRRMLKAGRSHKQQLPKTLFVARETVADAITREATAQDIEVVRVPESELLTFIGEAREGFAERFE
jgi:hypothetical protein